MRNSIYYSERKKVIITTQKPTAENLFAVGFILFKQLVLKSYPQILIKLLRVRINLAETFSGFDFTYSL